MSRPRYAYNDRAQVMCAYAKGDRVQVWHHGRWCPGTVRKIHARTSLLGVDFEWEWDGGRKSVFCGHFWRSEIRDPK